MTSIPLHPLFLGPLSDMADVVIGFLSGSIGIIADFLSGVLGFFFFYFPYLPTLFLIEALHELTLASVTIAPTPSDEGSLNPFASPPEGSTFGALTNTTELYMEPIALILVMFGIALVLFFRVFDVVLKTDFQSEEAQRRLLIAPILIFLWIPLANIILMIAAGFTEIFKNMDIVIDGGADSLVHDDIQQSCEASAEEVVGELDFACYLESIGPSEDGGLSGLIDGNLLPLFIAWLYMLIGALVYLIVAILAIFRLFALYMLYVIGPLAIAMWAFAWRAISDMGAKYIRYFILLALFPIPAALIETLLPLFFTIIEGSVSEVIGVEERAEDISTTEMVTSADTGTVSALEAIGTFEIIRATFAIVTPIALGAVPWGFVIGFNKAMAAGAAVGLGATAAATGGTVLAAKGAGVASGMTSNALSKGMSKASSSSAAKRLKKSGAAQKAAQWSSKGKSGAAELGNSIRSGTQDVKSNMREYRTGSAALTAGGAIKDKSVTGAKFAKKEASDYVDNVDSNEMLKSVEQSSMLSRTTGGGAIQSMAKGVRKEEELLDKAGNDWSEFAYDNPDAEASSESMDKSEERKLKAAEERVMADEVMNDEAFMREWAETSDHVEDYEELEDNEERRRAEARRAIAAWDDMSTEEAKETFNMQDDVVKEATKRVSQKEVARELKEEDSLWQQNDDLVELVEDYDDKESLHHADNRGRMDDDYNAVKSIVEDINNDARGSDDINLEGIEKAIADEDIEVDDVLSAAALVDDDGELAGKIQEITYENVNEEDLDLDGVLNVEDVNATGENATKLESNYNDYRYNNRDERDTQVERFGETLQEIQSELDNYDSKVSEIDSEISDKVEDVDLSFDIDGVSDKELVEAASVNFEGGSFQDDEFKDTLKEIAGQDAVVSLEESDIDVQEKIQIDDYDEVAAVRDEVASLVNEKSNIEVDIPEENMEVMGSLAMDEVKSVITKGGDGLDDIDNAEAMEAIKEYGGLSSSDEVAENLLGPMMEELENDIEKWSENAGLSDSKVEAVKDNTKEVIEGMQGQIVEEAEKVVDENNIGELKRQDKKRLADNVKELARNNQSQLQEIIGEEMAKGIDKDSKLEDGITAELDAQEALQIEKTVISEKISDNVQQASEDAIQNAIDDVDITTGENITTDNLTDVIEDIKVDDARQIQNELNKEIKSEQPLFDDE